jgi:hypothetical protein
MPFNAPTELLYSETFMKHGTRPDLACKPGPISKVEAVHTRCWDEVLFPFPIARGIRLALPFRSLSCAAPANSALSGFDFRDGTVAARTN